MALIREYLNLQKKYEAEYGNRTVLLMEMGNFYEIYEYDPTSCTSEDAKIDPDGKIWNEKIGHAIELSTTLNCNLTFQDGNKLYGISNPNKIGFPSIAFEKNRNTLLANDYTIIRMDQEKNGKKPKSGELVPRYVAEICSPTMQLESISLNRPTSNVACIYIEYQPCSKIKDFTESKFETFLITTGVAVLDVITGQNRVCEFHSKIEDQVCAIQELYRFLVAHYPRELLVHISDMPPELAAHSDANPNPYIRYLEKMLELQRFDRLFTQVNSVPPDYRRIPYQIEFLNKIFNPRQTSTAIQIRNERIIDELGLDRMMYGRVAYMLLLQHCYSYNPEIINRLSRPDLEWIDSHKHLILTHNAIIQLDLMSEGQRKTKRGEINSLMAVLDQNRTHLGRRALSNMILNPMRDPDQIQVYYDLIKDMNQHMEGEQLWIHLDRLLKELPDLGRLQRKLELKLIAPKELSILYQGYLKIINIYLLILKAPTPTLHKNLLTPADIENFNQFISRYGSIFDFTSLECCQFDTLENNQRILQFNSCPIRSGILPDLDRQCAILTETELHLQSIVDHLNSFLGGTTGKKITFKEGKKKPGAKKQPSASTVIKTTNSKAALISRSRVDTNLCGTLGITTYAANEKLITSDIINTLCHRIDEIKNWMKKYLLELYYSLIDEMTSKYTFYVPLANLIAKIDLVSNYAKVSFRNNYYRPEIVTEEGPSFLEAREIRHPIIERLIDGKYVTNDISLGKGYKEEEEVLRSNGMLLFGLNMAGKSSLVKAIALNIIMAQIGCYTPSHLRYKPYSKIITRLTKVDNMYQGLSSFAVEMSELRTILRQADSQTLVVGDELTSGTESNSGMAITGSTLISLIEKESTYIFATHLNELLKLSFMKQTVEEKLKVAHLSVSYDETTKLLIYERKLEDGPGLSTYGLMVAKYLNLPEEFLQVANGLLLEIMGSGTNIVSPKYSKYNRNIYVNICGACGKTKYQTTLHTHHIVEQKYADERGIIMDETGILHKNTTDNLIVLCEDCHRQLHQSNEELETLVVPNGKLIRTK